MKLTEERNRIIKEHDTASIISIESNIVTQHGGEGKKGAATTAQLKVCLLLFYPPIYPS
jgi:predicted transposase YbfD/YdcC